MRSGTSATSRWARSCKAARQRWRPRTWRLATKALTGSLLRGWPRQGTARTFWTAGWTGSAWLRSTLAADGPSARTSLALDGSAPRPRPFLTDSFGPEWLWGRAPATAQPRCATTAPTPSRPTPGRMLTARRGQGVLQVELGQTEAVLIWRNRSRRSGSDITR